MIRFCVTAAAILGVVPLSGLCAEPIAGGYVILPEPLHCPETGASQVRIDIAAFGMPLEIQELQGKYETCGVKVRKAGGDINTDYIDCFDYRPATPQSQLASSSGDAEIDLNGTLRICANPWSYDFAWESLQATLRLGDTAVDVSGNFEANVQKILIDSTSRDVLVARIRQKLPASVAGDLELIAGCITLPTASKLKAEPTVRIAAEFVIEPKGGACINDACPPEAVAAMKPKAVLRELDAEEALAACAEVTQ